MQLQKFTPMDISQVPAHELALATASLEENSPKVWIELAEILWVGLRNAQALKDIPDVELSDVVAMQVKQMAFSIGGSGYYIPKGYVFSARAKAAKIAKDFDGKNTQMLARKHGVSDNRIRQILHEQDVYNRPKGTHPWRK